MHDNTLTGFFGAASGGLFYRDRAITYATLADESARLAGALRAVGVGQGDRVALWLPNTPAWLATFFACAQLGAIAVSVNTRFRSHEISDIVRRTRAKVLCYWPGFRQIDFSAILAGCDAEALSSLCALVAYHEEDGGVPAEVIGRPVHSYAGLIQRPALADDVSRPDSGCIIFTTSGTTRAPKFVLHDQKALMRHATDVATAFGYNDERARVLVTAPLCGVFGFCNAMAVIAAGRSLLMYPTFDARQAVNAMRQYAITHAHATDDMIHQMLAAAPEPQPFPGVKFFGYGAFSPALADLPARAEARGLRLVGLYGMSELQAFVALQDELAPLSDRSPAGGRLVAADGQVRVSDTETGAVLAHGVAGELQFRVPSLMALYFENDEATRSAFTVDGWFRTGDLGYTLADGRFVFVARLGDALRLSGFMVSPAEIEDVLQEHASVDMAQVVGAETEAGVKPVAFVVLKPGAKFDEQVLLAHCAGRIAKFKVPVRVVAVEDFPVTPGANATKIQKAKLREWAQGLLQA